MKRSVGYLITVAVFGSLAWSNASTIANWRFEEGTAGVQHSGNHDGFYLDSSGNGNHLSAWADSMNPTATSDVPFAGQGGATNTLALDFEGWNSVSNNIGTWEW